MRFHCTCCHLCLCSLYSRSRSHQRCRYACILYVHQGTSLTHLQHNCINMKIIKRNAAVEYMQKVSVAEPKAMPVVWTSTRQWECFACLIAASNWSERHAGIRRGLELKIGMLQCQESFLGSHMVCTRCIEKKQLVLCKCILAVLKVATNADTTLENAYTVKSAWKYETAKKIWHFRRDCLWDAILDD